MLVDKLLTENNFKITYKLLHDLLFVIFIFFLLALLAEGLLPGIVSSRVGLYKILLLILSVIFLINAASKKAGVTTSSVSGKTTGFVLVFILSALILNGTRGIGLAASVFVVFPALAALYLFYRIFFSPMTSS